MMNTALTIVSAKNCSSPILESPLLLAVMSPHPRRGRVGWQGQSYLPVLIHSPTRASARLPMPPMRPRVSEHSRIKMHSTLAIPTAPGADAISLSGRLIVDNRLLVSIGDEAASFGVFRNAPCVGEMQQVFG